MVLAVLGAIDSLLTSLVADSLTSDYHDSDKELRGESCVSASCSCTCKEILAAARLGLASLAYYTVLVKLLRIRAAGQGIGNALSGLFGGVAGAGATVRTVVNVRAGGRTPLSGALHSLVLLAIVAGLGRFASLIPLATLGGESAGGM